MNEIHYFSKQLLEWHAQHNNRSMPWKGIKNPYYIWLSEIILQQTRVEQGLAYYEKFIRLFPTLSDLALADEQLVFNAWQGLGYYSRCRNLIKTAQYLHQHASSRFPETFETLRQLPGIGDYTAAAIASFAFKAPHAAVDGNVIRILSRFLSSSIDPASLAGKRFFSDKANMFLSKEHPDLFNQAMMDLGATICTPKKPQCHVCPLNDHCNAFQQKNMEAFPFKKKKKPLKERHFHFAIIVRNRKMALVKRSSGDIWADLYTPWMIETHGVEVVWPDAFKARVIAPVCEKQLLTHQKIWGYFHDIQVPPKSLFTEQSFFWVPLVELKHLTFPRMVLAFLKKSGYL